MRILIWTDAFWPEIGGIEVFCMRLATGLRHRGHECLILTNERRTVGPGFDHYQGIPVHRFPFQATLFKNNLAAVRDQHEACVRLIEEFKPEAIHLHCLGSTALHFILQQKKWRRPTVFTLHDNILFGAADGIGATVFDKVDAIVAISESIRNDTLSYNPRLEHKLHTILNALPMPKTLPDALPQTPRILAFGRLVKAKGFDLAIHAFARLALRFPDASMTIAGDGDEMLNLRTLAQESGFANRIDFLGYVPAEEIPELINRHALVIMPSRWKEPFGLVALQTAQMGRPIIASHTGAIPEIVVDGVTGKLFENESLPALSAALQHLLENRELCETLGRQARVHAMKNFDFDRFIAAYENLYLRAQAPIPAHSNC